MKNILKSKKPDNKLLELEKQSQEYLEGWKRCKADFENYKRNQEDWMKNFREEALEGFFEELIPVLNNFNLAMRHVPENEENKSLREGVSFIEKQLKDVLFSRGLTTIETRKGDIFNPQIHECLETINENSHKPNQEKKGGLEENKSVVIVEEVVSPGYKLKGKVLSPAKVKTSLSK